MLQAQKLVIFYNNPLFLQSDNYKSLCSSKYPYFFSFGIFILFTFSGFYETEQSSIVSFLQNVDKIWLGGLLICLFILLWLFFYSKICLDHFRFQLIEFLFNLLNFAEAVESFVTGL